MLSKSSLDEASKNKIIDHVKNMKLLFSEHIDKKNITDTIPVYNQADFPDNKIKIDFPDLFIESDLYYTYEEYEKHLNATKVAASSYESYKLKFEKEPEFSNIRLHTIVGNYSTISKSTHPTIHFVVRHPILRDAIENIVSIFKD